MRRRPFVDHFEVAAACRTNPGTWQPVGEYNSTQTANGMISHIRNAGPKRARQRSAYTPAGTFEARHALTEFGARVEARYVGVMPAPEPITDLAAAVRELGALPMPTGGAS